MDDPIAERQLDELADALPFLIARDDERPPLWLTPRFDAQVAATRSRLVALVQPRRLLSAIEDAEDLVRHGGRGRFERAARHLGHDASAVAVAIRWLEVRSDRRLPGWSELLRTRFIEPLMEASAEPAGRHDPSLWFG